MFYLQASVAVLGILVLLLGPVKLGRQEISRPMVSLIGTLLTGQFVFCFWCRLFVGVLDSYTPLTETPGLPVDSVQAMAWFEIFILFVAILFAAVLTHVGYHDPEELADQMAVMPASGDAVTHEETRPLSAREEYEGEIQVQVSPPWSDPHGVRRSNAADR